MEARKKRVNFADYFDANEFIEALFGASQPQADDLQIMVRAAIREWQAKHNLAFLPHTFSETRNEEFIDARPPKGEATAEPNDPATPSAPDCGEQA